MPYADPAVAKERGRRYYIENKASRLAWQKQYQMKNNKVRNEYRRQWGKENKEKNRQYGLIRRYGITSQHYDEMLIEQDGRCAICSALPGVRRLHVDHNHLTNEIRGLLCGNCNIALQHDHDINYYNKVIAYLQGKKNG